MLANGSNNGVWKNIVKTRTFLKNFNIEPKEIVSRNSLEGRWESEFTSDNHFMVCFLRERIELSSHMVNDGPLDWDSHPIYDMLAKQGRIPSAVALCQRGITIPSTICGACNQEEERSDHILITCTMARMVMDNILNWCEINCERFSLVKDMLLFASRWSECSKKNSLLNMILYGMLWCIWDGRNKRVFEGIPMRSETIVERIKAQMFTWCKYRPSHNKAD